jgi:hypothetical protein
VHKNFSVLSAISPSSQTQQALRICRLCILGFNKLEFKNSEKGYTVADVY